MRLLVLATALAGTLLAATRRSHLLIEPGRIEGGPAAPVVFRFQAPAGEEADEFPLELVEDCLLLLTEDRSAVCSKTGRADPQAIGALKDDGGEGDSMAGDSLYTLTTNLDVAGPRRLTFAARLPTGLGPRASLLVTRADTPDEARARLADAAESADGQGLRVEFLEADARAIESRSKAERRELAKIIRFAPVAGRGATTRFRLKGWAGGRASTLVLREDPIRGWTPLQPALVP